MATLEKSTITLTTAAVVLVSVVGLITTLLTVWFTASNAVERGFEKVNARIDLVEDRQQRLENDFKDLRYAAANYIGAGLKPEEIKPKNYR